MATTENTSRERILQVVQELGHQQKTFSRQRIADLTGLRLPVVDDHLDRMRDDGLIVKVIAGVYELVRQYPAFEPVSYTPLLDQGILIIEQGDVVIKMGFPAARMHAMMMAGFMQQLRDTESESEMRQAVSQLQADTRANRRAQASTTRAVQRLQRKSAGNQIDMWPEPNKPARPKEAGEEGGGAPHGRRTESEHA